MNSLVSVKVSIQELSPAFDSIGLDDTILCISCNHVSTLFKAPFTLLPLQLSNFPMMSLINFRFYSDTNCVAEGQVDIESLKMNQFSEFQCEIKTPEDLDSPEKYRPKEITLKNKNYQGTLKVLIEKEELKTTEKNDFFEEFLGIKENLLKSIGEINKNIEIAYDEKISNFEKKIKQINEFEELNQQKVKNIKCYLLGVNEKLKVLETVKEKYNSLYKKNIEERRTRENMQFSYKKACGEWLKIKETLESSLKDLTEKNYMLEKKLKSLEKVEIECEEDKKTTAIQIETLENKIKALETQQITSKISEELIKSLQSELNSKETALANQQASFKSTLENIDQIVSSHQSTISDLLSENKLISESLTKVLQENQMLKAQNSQFLSESFFLNAQINEAQSQSLYIKELEVQIQKFEENLNKAKENSSNFPKDFKEFKEVDKEADQEKISLIEKNKQLSEENCKLMQELNKNQIINAQHQSKSSAIPPAKGRFYSHSKKSSRVFEDLNEFSEVSYRFDSEKIIEVMNFTQNLLQTSERCLFLERVQSKLLLILGDKEAEIQVLRELVIDLQKDRQIYIPVRGDFIDNTLANYLNSRPGKLSVPFVRLDTGVYLFGTKRVILRVENIGIVIRIGGGFIKIEDFITTNSGFELMKISNKETGQRLEGAKSPEPAEIERAASPKINYTHRNSITSSIPLPKSVTNATQKKMSNNPELPKKTLLRRGTLN